MAQQGDLTTLPKVKDWLNTSNQAFPSGSDAKLADLITRASRFVNTHCHRLFVPQTYAESRDGTGTDALFLRNRPVISVTSLVIGNDTVEPSVQGGFGYLNDDTRVFIVGSYFPAWPRLSVKVTYVAGFQATASAAVPQSGSTLAASDLLGTSQVDGTPAGSWTADRGVTMNGAPMTLVAGQPQESGQYSVAAGPDGTWAYSFFAGDAGQPITVTYGYVPADLEQAVVELVGERFKSRNRIGETTQHVGQGATVSFSQKDFNAYVADTLNDYTDRVPV